MSPFLWRKRYRHSLPTPAEGLSPGHFSHFCIAGFLEAAFFYADSQDEFVEYLRWFDNEITDAIANMFTCETGSFVLTLKHQGGAPLIDRARVEDLFRRYRRKRPNEKAKFKYGERKKIISELERETELTNGQIRSLLFKPPGKKRRATKLFEP